MRIGIDARQLTGPLIGTRRALEEVLQEWRISGLNGHEVVLYIPRNVREELHAPYRCRVGSGISRVIGGTFWLQSELPLMIRQDKLDVFWGTTDILPLPIAQRIPCLLTVQDLGYHQIPQHLSSYVRLVYRLFFKKSLQAAAAIICTTSAVKEELERYGCRGDKINVVHHGVNLNVFSAPSPHRQAVIEKYGLHSPFFLFVGHLRPNKNLERTLLAFRAFLSKSTTLPAPLLVIAGGRTSQDGAIFELINDPALAEHVRYLGYVPSEDLPPLYQSGIGFVSPSIYEGFGLPFLEAMAAGIPVIAPAIPTAQEICGDAAWYVDPMEVQSITTAFMRLWEDGRERECLRQKSLERVQRFGWAHAAKEILGMLESIAK